MPKNRALVPGSSVIPCPLAWQPRPSAYAAWDDYAGVLPLPVLAERSLAWAHLPAARLQELARGTAYEVLAALYLGAFETAVLAAYADPGKDDDASDGLFDFLPAVQHAVIECVHRAVRFRIRIATRLVEEHGEHDGDRYALQVFVDTHLDWLAAAMRYGEVDDRFWLAEGHLTAVYPLPNRVRCADELPNLAPLLLHADLLMEAAKTKQVCPRCSPLLIPGGADGGG